MPEGVLVLCLIWTLLAQRICQVEDHEHGPYILKREAISFIGDCF